MRVYKLVEDVYIKIGVPRDLFNNKIWPYMSTTHPRVPILPPPVAPQPLSRTALKYVGEAAGFPRVWPNSIVQRNYILFGKPVCVCCVLCNTVIDKDEILEQNGTSGILVYYNYMVCTSCYKLVELRRRDGYYC